MIDGSYSQMKEGQWTYELSDSFRAPVWKGARKFQEGRLWLALMETAAG